MSDNHLKTPLAKSLNRFAEGKSQDRVQLIGKSLPCSVKEVVGSGIVKVNLEVDTSPWTLPVLQVPVAYPEYIRYPIQVGDKGMLVSADARLGGVTGLGSGTPDLTPPANLGACVFLWLGNKEWTDPIDPDAVEIYGVGSKGVILRDGDNTVSVTLTSSGIVIETNGNPVTINGGGDVQVNGGGDVLAGSISLLTHHHTGVTTGGGNTGGPA